MPNKRPAHPGKRPAPENFWSDQLDRVLARPMWVASVVFLAVLACEIQRVRGAQAPGISIFGWCLIALWPLFWLELAAHLVVGSRNRRYNLLYALLPPLRLGGRDHETWRQIWLPGLGWQPVGRELRLRIEKFFGLPMIVIALAVLPLLAIEWFYNPTELAGDADSSRDRLLRMTVEAGTSLIWFAFAFELVVMVAVVRKKLRYVVEHWIDVAIVALPMVAFLRVVWLIQIGNMSRLLRTYRLRGMAVRAYRAVLMLDIVRRLLHINPERRLRALGERLEEYHYHIEETRREMRELEAKIAARRLEEEDGTAEASEPAGVPEPTPDG